MALTDKEMLVISDRILNSMIKKAMIQLKKDKTLISDIIKSTIEQDVLREKEIDKKALIFINNYSEQIKQENIDQSKFIQMIKRKIAEQEGFVL